MRHDHTKRIICKGDWVWVHTGTLEVWLWQPDMYTTPGRTDLSKFKWGWDLCEAPARPQCSNCDSSKEKPLSPGCTSPAICSELPAAWGSQEHLPASPPCLLSQGARLHCIMDSSNLLKLLTKVSFTLPTASPYLITCPSNFLCCLLLQKWNDTRMKWMAPLTESHGMHVTVFLASCSWTPGSCTLGTDSGDGCSSQCPAWLGAALVCYLCRLSLPPWTKKYSLLSTVFLDTLWK